MSRSLSSRECIVCKCVGVYIQNVCKSLMCLFRRALDKMERVSRCCSAAFTAFSRTKTVDVQRIHDTELKRCLGVIDLIGLGQQMSLSIFTIAGVLSRRRNRNTALCDIYSASMYM